MKEKLGMKLKKKAKLKRKANNGITLIALVITIIVLLILAGVTIATLTGENGILTKATESKERTTQATAEEMVSVAIGGLQTANLGDTSKITPEAIANQVMKDNNIENVVAEGSTFPTNIIFQDDGVKVEVNLDISEQNNESYDGIYSEGGLEGKIAPENIFNYEIIDDGAVAATGMDSLPEKTVKITGIKPEYCNYGGYTPDGGTTKDTNYVITLDDGSTIDDTLVIPYEVDGKNVPNGIEGEKYTVVEANVTCYWEHHEYGYKMSAYCFPNVKTIIFPNTIKKVSKIDGHVYGGTYDYNIQKVILSDNIQIIDKETFSDCTQLSSVSYKGKIYTSSTELMNALQTDEVECDSGEFQNMDFIN